MNPSNKTSGFTLIELLVVIAIIGLLSSIILASLNTAKLKAQDSRVMSEMVNLRTAAEMYRTSQGNYSDPLSTNQGNNAGPCPINWSIACCSWGFMGDTTSNATSMLSDIKTLNNTLPTNSGPNFTNVMCSISPTSYMVVVKLPSTTFSSVYSGNFVCIDSAGKLETGSGLSWSDYENTSGNGQSVPYSCK